MHMHVCVYVCMCEHVCLFCLHRDLYWEQRHDKVGFPSSLTEEGDVRLPEYPLPEKVETLLEQGKYNNVENKITKVRGCGK